MMCKLSMQFWENQCRDHHNFFPNNQNGSIPRNACVAYKIKCVTAREKRDYQESVTTGQTDTGLSVSYVPLCFADNTTKSETIYLFPPRESCSNRVSLESLYGTWDPFFCLSPKAEMTFPKASCKYSNKKSIYSTLYKQRWQHKAQNQLATRNLKTLISKQFVFFFFCWVKLNVASKMEICHSFLSYRSYFAF